MSSWATSILGVEKFITVGKEFRETTMKLNYKEGSFNSRPINVRSGIFQGDFLPLLLFWFCLAPLSTMLNNTGHRYEIQRKTITYLFYMDDIETFAKRDSQQEGLLQNCENV